MTYTGELCFCRRREGGQQDAGHGLRRSRSRDHI